MRIRFLAALLLLAAPLRADDLNARAAQIKTQLQTTLLPAWAAKSPANESASDAAQLLQTLSHAHRLGYSTPQLDLLGAARVHYRLLRDSRRDKTGDGFFLNVQEAKEAKRAVVQAQVVSALVEYARASGENEPRALAVKIWRLVRDRARDKTNGGFFDAFLSTTAPLEASGQGNKSDFGHSTLLKAGTELFLLTRDNSIKRDVVELLDLNEGRFFPTRTENGFAIYTPDWKPFLLPTSIKEMPFAPIRTTPLAYARGGVAIARAQNALGLPVRWIDLAHRAEDMSGDDAPDLEGNPLDGGPALDALSLLARNIGPSRERRAVQIDAALNTLNGKTPDASLGLSLLDFVAAFESSPSTP